jgi:hypothetical protein
MTSRFLIRGTTMACLVLAGVPAFAQVDFKAVVVKHLKTSRDFTLKVAEQMPEADYGFKLTPPQMSFAEQIAHLAREQAGFLAAFTGEKATLGKPVSMNKKDVIAFARQSFDTTIEKVSKLTPEQIAKTYTDPEGTITGVYSGGIYLLMGRLVTCIYSSEL